MQYDVSLSGQVVALTRGFRLSPDGLVLDGFERLPVSSPAKSAAIYFHTLFKTTASKSADGSVALQTKGGQRWRVTSDLGELAVQPSLQLAHPAGRQDTICVCIQFDPVHVQTVAWRWVREA